MHRQSRLDTAGRSRSRFEVTNIGLHRTDADGATVTPPALTDDRIETLNLDFVPNNSGRAVALKKIDIHRIDARSRISPLQGHALTPRIGGGDALALTVTGGANTTDDRIDPVTITAGIRQALEHQNPCTFAHHETIGVLVKGCRLVG